MSTAAYDRFVTLIKDLNRLSAALALLHWDQETFMPPKGAGARADQIATLSELVHQRLVSPEMGDLIADLQENPPGGFEDYVSQTNIREVKRVRDRAVKIPSSLVRDLAQAGSLGQTAWAKAREKGDFASFAPFLEKLLNLKRQEADAVGYKVERYDALLDEYEPGTTTAEVVELFARLRDELVPLVEQIAASPHQPDASILHRECQLEKQVALSRTIASEMGFDFQAGRIDVAPHPFCSGTSMHDVRLTTRYDLRFLPMSFFSTVHEAGHGLYEQGFVPEHAGTPMAEAASHAIHESQSRLWENLVARSLPFWEFCFHRLQEHFAPVWADVTVTAWYAAINRVAPSPIRTEADEVTYNLHIILRFEMERALLNGMLSVADVPRRWNELMRSYLGITPADDRQGCLQDIHWSMGAFGYFPSYTMGNLYAAQFFAAAEKAVPNLIAHIRHGRLLPLREWLRENIHCHGQRYRANELVHRVTGSPLSHQPFMKYLHSKFGSLYKLASQETG